MIKVTGIERKVQRGPARVFDREEDAMHAVLAMARSRTATLW